jgi:hypothetical protein
MNVIKPATKVEVRTCLRELADIRARHAEGESQRRAKIETVFRFELGAAYQKLKPAARELLVMWLDEAGKLVNPFDFEDMERRADAIQTKE